MYLLKKDNWQIFPFFRSSPIKKEKYVHATILLHETKIARTMTWLSINMPVAIAHVMDAEII